MNYTYILMLIQIGDHFSTTPVVVSDDIDKLWNHVGKLKWYKNRADCWITETDEEKEQFYRIDKIQKL